MLILPSQTEDDFPYEQDIQRNPGSTKPWLAYIEYKLQHGTTREQAFVMERACAQLPRSYKLWKMVCHSFIACFGATTSDSRTVPGLQDEACCKAQCRHFRLRVSQGQRSF